MKGSSILQSDFSPANWVPTKIAAGIAHTVLVSDTGVFYGFGLGRHGELGYDAGFGLYRVSKLNLPIPEIKDKLTPQVAVGAKCTVVLADGKLYSLGDKGGGRLGHSQTHGQVKIPNDDRIGFVSCSSDYSIAVSEDGYNLYVWGFLNFGEKVWKKEGEIPLPTLFHISSDQKEKKKILQIASGSRHCIALDEHGFVYTWGYGEQGRLGHGKVANAAEPLLLHAFVVPPEQRVVQITAGDSHSLALTREGLVFSWGSGSYGRLGLGSEADTYTPTAIEGLTKVVSVSCHSFHSCAVTKNMVTTSLYTWGGGKYGKLGLGEKWGQANALVPKIVQFPETVQVTRAVCGLHHTVAVAQGHLYAWGYADGLRCGVESDKNFFLSPVAVPDIAKGIYQNIVEKKEVQIRPAYYRAKLVASGEAHSMVLTANGDLLAWGSNTYGQLGIGNQGIKQSFVSRPTNVNFGVSGRLVIQAIACGSAHSLALAESAVFAWGRNDRGQLGLGDCTHYIVPTLIKALQGTEISKIAAGQWHSAAIEMQKKSTLTAKFGEAGSSTNKIYVWGSNKEGQLGLGEEAPDIQMIPAPLVMAHFDYFEVDIALGWTHTLILGKNYTPESYAKSPKITKSALYACGTGIFGQLGLAELTKKVKTPQLISDWGEETAKQIKDKEKQEEAKKKADLEKKDKNRDWCFSMFTSDKSTDVEMDRTYNGKEKKRKGRKWLPLIKMIAASERSSMAIVVDTKTKLERVYAWGMVPGVFPQSVLHPQPLDAFEAESLREDETPVYQFNVKSISMAKRHGLLLCQYNRERHNKLFAWGETKYGKLGIGNVPDFLESRAESTQAKKRQTATEVEEGDDKEESHSILPPISIPYFKDKFVTNVSCYGDHSLVASETTGRVFVFGYGDSGRLGLGDAKNDVSSHQSLHDPFPLHMFKDPTKSDRTSALAQTEEEEADQLEGKPQTKSGESGDTQLQDDGEGIGPARSTEQQTSVETVSEIDLQKKQLDVLKDIKQLIKTRKKNFIPYAEALKDLQRERDLVDLAIAERARESQGGNSRTQRYRNALRSHLRAQKRRQAREKKNLANPNIKCDGCGIMLRRLKFKCVHCTKHDYCERCYVKSSPNYQPLLQGLTLSSDKHEFKRMNLTYLRTDAEDEMKYGILQTNKRRRPEGELSPLETLISRMHLRPCLILRIFNSFKEQITKAQEKINNFTTSDSLLLMGDEDAQSKPDSAKYAFERMQGLKQDFCDLLFGILDPNRKRDMRIMQIFLRQMLHEHASSCTQPEQVLAPNTLEWEVWLRVFCSGTMKRHLGRILAHAIEQVGPFESKKVPTIKFEQWVQNGRRPEDIPEKVEKAWVAIRKKTDALFFRLTDKNGRHFQALMHAIQWLAELLFDALTRAAHATHPVLGQRILDALAHLMIQDQYYQYSIKETNPIRIAADDKTAGNLGTAQLDSMKLMIIGLMGVGRLEEELKVRWNIDTKKFHVESTGLRGGKKKDGGKKDSSAGDLYSLRQNRDIKDLLKNFEDQLKLNVTSRQAQDPLVQGKYDTGKHILLQQLYEDFLKLRSVYIPRHAVLRPQIIRFIEDNWRGIASGNALHMGWEASKDDPDVNAFGLRLDPFHVDFDSPMMKCHQCGFQHPRMIGIEKDLEEDKKKAVDPDTEIREERITTPECKDLLSVLERPAFKRVIYTFSAEATWKELLDLMAQERKKAMSVGHYEEGHTFENAASILRRLKKIKKTAHTKLYLGDTSTQPISQGDLIDPEPLLAALNEFKSKQQDERRLIIKRNDTLIKINNEMNKEILRIQTEVARLKATFNNICQGSLRGTLEGIASPKFKQEKYNVEALVRHMRKYTPIKVYKTRGLLKRYSYVALVGKGILQPVPDDPREFSGYCCFCFKCCFCWYACCAVSLFKNFMGKRARTHSVFLRNLHFVFISTESSDIIQLKLIYKVVGSFGDTDLLVTKQLSLSELAGTKEPCNSDRVEYDPTGDNVPIRGKQEYIFNREALLRELSNFPRPHGMTLQPTIDDTSDELTGFDMV